MRPPPRLNSLTQRLSPSWPADHNERHAELNNEDVEALPSQGVERQPHAMPAKDTAPARELSLKRLALSAGTGEDVAAMMDRGSRIRWKLSRKAFALIAGALIVMLCGIFVWQRAAQGVSSPALSAAVGEDPPAQADTNPSSGTATTPASAHTSSTAETPAQGAAGTKNGTVVVYVSGQVAKPGVYTLPEDSRVDDVVRLAGGMTKNADPQAVNLAEILHDADHIHVAAVGEAPRPEQNKGSRSSGTEQLVNINEASAQDLEALPGIGPALAQAIVSWRENNGAFASVDQLSDVSGIGEATLAKLRDHVRV
ncbi:MAG: helix-hairpin-helix domain-containing protein [Actinomycetaceae bacterium]|nr:helix-hairpin-helix domain-containing protein [Actinomycetaceae bacterium]MDY6083116.1 helix-hairpin-helix domain-containing protein [Actinomycetaceae bacterium]